jgi:hypothetical protein
MQKLAWWQVEAALFQLYQGQSPRWAAMSIK